MSTIKVPDVVPSPTEDCQQLKKAFPGWGTDEKAIIRILGRRNACQRKKIRETYQQIYNNSLIDSLRSELSGDFGKAVILWTCDPAERDARMANETLKSKNKSITQLQVIVEIACASSPHHLVAVRQAYCSLFDSSLEEDITLNVSQPVRKIVRDSVVRLGTDEDSLTRAIVTRAETDMMKVRGEYFNVNKSSLENDVIADTSWDYRDFLMTLLGEKI